MSDHTIVIIWVMKIFFVQFFCVFLLPLLNIFYSVRSVPFLSFIEPVFAYNVPLVSLIFLKRSLVFPILLFSSISLQWSLGKAFLSLLAGGCDRCTKHSREELPHIRDQGQKPEGPHAQRAAARRSYATSEIRGSGQECQAGTAQERLRGVTQVRGQGQQPRGATPHPRPGAAARRSNPTSKKRWLRGHRRA